MGEASAAAGQLASASRDRPKVTKRPEGRHLVVKVEGQARHERRVLEAARAWLAVLVPHLFEGLDLAVLAREEDGGEEEDGGPQRRERIHVARAAQRILERR